jgi:hypothetical protein
VRFTVTEAALPLSEMKSCNLGSPQVYDNASYLISSSKEAWNISHDGGPGVSRSDRRRSRISFDDVFIGAYVKPWLAISER